jgi:hypothetical protein
VPLSTTSLFLRLCSRAAALNEAVFDDPYTDSSVPTELQLIAYDRPFDSGTHPIERAMKKPYDEADSRGKLHPAWHPQVKARGAHVVEKTVEAERLIINVDTPNSRLEDPTRSRLCPAFRPCTSGMKGRFQHG